MRDETFMPTTAAEWFLAVNAAQDPSAEVLQAWLRWFESSEDNRRAFEEVAQVWHGTPAAIIARRAQPAGQDDYDGAVPVAQWRSQSRKAMPLRLSRLRRRAARDWLATAAAFGMVGLLGWYYLSPAPISSGRFVTAMGEHRTLKLADGSRVTLGGASELSVDLQPGQRRLRLTAGEAYFVAHKDPRRPFVVQAMNGAITAVGTAFNIRALEDRVTVTVTEGIVRVAGSDGAGNSITPMLAPGLRLTRGEQTTYRGRDGAPTLDSAAIKRVDAAESARWRDGWLVYRDEPLEYVIADIARYSDLKVTLAGSARALKFSGAVFKDDIAEWIVALPEVAPVVVAPEEGGFVIDRRMPRTVVAP